MFSVAVSRRIFGALVALALIAPATAPGQAASRTLRRTVLVGSVRDSSGHALSGVEVWLRGADLYAHTNEAGGFRIADAPEGAGKLSLRRLGYEQATVDIDVKVDLPDSIVVQLTAVPTNLAGMTVEEESRSKRMLAGFWDRRGKGMGHYLTRDEIDDKHSHDFVDLVRMFPGVNIVSVGGRPQVRLRGQTVKGDCPPLYWLDGMRIEAATSEEFPPNTLEAVEVYNGVATIPLQFQPRPNSPQKTCGAVVIWTRLPGT